MLSFLRLARLQFVAGGLFVFIFGAALGYLSGVPFSLPQLLLGYLVVLPAHLAVSFSNDYYDSEQDAAGSPAFFSGGSGVLIQSPHLRKVSITAAILLTAMSMLVGIGYVIRFSLPLWFIGIVLAGNLSGWIYSAPPVRLASRGLGEILAGLTVGVLVPLSGYAAATGTLGFTWWPLWLVLFFYNTAFIVAVSIPDVEADRQGGKLTWAVRYGRSFAYSLVGVLFVAALMLLFSVRWLAWAPVPAEISRLGFLSLLPLGVWRWMVSRRPSTQSDHARAVFWIIVSMIIFLILADAWLIFLAFQAAWQR